MANYTKEAIVIFGSGGSISRFGAKITELNGANTSYTYGSVPLGMEDVTQDGEPIRNDRTEKALKELVDRLVKDGWEPKIWIGHAPYWYSHRFNM